MSKKSTEYVSNQTDDLSFFLYHWNYPILACNTTQNSLKKNIVFTTIKIMTASIRAF